VWHLWIEKGVNRSLIIGGSNGMKVFSVEGLEHDVPLSLVPILHLEDLCNIWWLCVSDSPAGNFLILERLNENTRIWYFNDWGTFDYAQEKSQN
jgi:hypothetical protein